MRSSYSSSELASLLSVNESTVKRWSDEGHIECMRTHGGHRRFSVPSIMRFIQKNNLELPEVATQLFELRDLHAQLIVGNTRPLTVEMRTAAMDGNVDALVNLLRVSLAFRRDLLEVYSEFLSCLFAEDTEKRESGTTSGDLQPLAIQALREALIRFQSDVHCRDLNGLTALCGCFESERYDLGLYCLSSYLRAEGWRVRYLGADIPTGDLLSAITRWKPAMTVLHATVIDDEWKFLSHVADRIAPEMQKTGGKLVLVGDDLEERFGRKLKADAIASTLADFKTIAEPSHFTTPS